jgi:ketosteroid isomerase-like protein
LAATLLACGCAGASGFLTPQVTVERDLLAADRAFSDMSARQGVAAAFAAYMDPQDGMMVRPGAISEGAKAIGESFAETPRDLVLTWTPDRAYGAGSGDFGVTTGRFARARPGDPGVQGRYVTVWRKDRTGAWKALMDIGNTDPPAPPAR